MLSLALSAIFVLSLLKPIEGAAGNSLKVNRLSSSILTVLYFNLDRATSLVVNYYSSKS